MGLTAKPRLSPEEVNSKVDRMPRERVVFVPCLTFPGYQDQGHVSGIKHQYNYPSNLELVSLFNLLVMTSAHRHPYHDHQFR